MKSIPFFTLALALSTAGALAGPPAPGDEHWFFDYGGPSGDPFDLVHNGDYIYMAGGFLNVEGDTNKKNLARFNRVTETWEQMPGIDRFHNNFVVSLFDDKQGSLWVSGDFSSIGGVTANKIARFQIATETWSALTDTTPPSSGQETGPTNGGCDAVVRSGNFVYIGGDFSSTPRFIRRFNLSTNNWEAVGAGLDARVFSLEVLPNGNILAGGGFTGGLKEWDGSTWSTVGGGINGTGVVRVTKWRKDGVLFVGGDFDQAGAGAGLISASKVASYNGTSWDNLNGGLGAQTEDLFNADGVYDMDIDVQGRVYIAGDFTRSAVGNTLIQRVAYWDDTGAWKAMGSGVGLSGSQIAFPVLTIGSDVYVGGVFSKGYDAPNAKKNFARWNADIDFPATFVIGAYAAQSTLRFYQGGVSAPDENVIEFATRDRTVYELQSSADMVTWNAPFLTVTGDGTMQAFLLTKPFPQRYYRFRISNP